MSSPNTLRLYQRFIDAGCDREARNNDGNTPLFMYVTTVEAYGDDVLTLPLRPNPQDDRNTFAAHDVHAVNNEGDTLLHVVAGREDDHVNSEDRWDVSKLLVESGLDPRKENKRQVTPLDVAAAYGNERILKLYAKDE